MKIDLSAAIRAITPGAAIAPNDRLTELRTLASVYLETGCHDDARGICRQILDLCPGDPHALDVLSQCPFDLTEFDLGPSEVPCRRTAAPVEDPSAVLAQLLARPGFRAIQKLGYHLQRNDYYSPVNDCDFLEQNADLWKESPEPADIDWRIDGQVETARSIAPFTEELRGIPDFPNLACGQFGWRNNFWNNADAVAQYGIVRTRKPRRYVEVGCGWSSLLLKMALEKNAAEGSSTAVTLVEPHPNGDIFPHLPSEWTVFETIMQRVPLGVFESLEAGDVLFYDGSHCAKVASDVTWFFFRILPRLKPGVIIHLHDIHLPQDYSDDVVFERGQTWNEQYVLQAFLMHNSAYRILLANRYLPHRRPEAMKEMCRGVQPAFGCSFWMEKIATR